MRSIPSFYRLTRSVPSRYRLTRSVPSLYRLTRSVPSLYRLTRSVPSLYSLTKSVPSLYRLTRHYIYFKKITALQRTALNGPRVNTESFKCHSVSHVRSGTFIVLTSSFLLNLCSIYIQCNHQSCRQSHTFWDLGIN